MGKSLPRYSDDLVAKVLEITEDVMACFGYHVSDEKVRVGQIYELGIEVFLQSGA